MTGTVGWIPVGLSASFDPATSTGTHIDGKELVIWRDNSGQAHVWEDRCPHRGMRLSFGFVRGDHIACLYHGWQFDRQGQCQYIPAHPQLDVPKTIHVARYETAENAGLIWTRVQTENSDLLPPYRPVCLPVRSLYLETTEQLAWDILSGRADVAKLALNLWELKIKQDVLLVGLQKLNDTRLGLHFTLVAPVSTEPRQVQIQMLSWIRELRLAFDNPQKWVENTSFSHISEVQ